MLRELHIAGLAIIEKMDIELLPGLNVFTGQTGAGKSLILGALELLLGLRGGGEDAALFVRPGSPEARVSGVFEIFSPSMAERLAGILDQSIQACEPILITRRVQASGRSSVSVNGSPVTAAMLREAGGFLVDIHGQHDQQFLLKPANQLLILDAFADAAPARAEFAEVLARLREAQRTLRELRESEDKRAEQLELYRFQMEEIDEARPVAGEYAQAKNRYTVLKNAAHLKAESAGVLQGLCEGDETVLDRLGKLGHSLAELARLDPSLADLAGQVEQAEGALADVAKGLERYQEKLDVDPAELGQVEERLNTLNHLIHKYVRTGAPAGDPVAAVLEHRRQIGQKSADLEAASQSLGSLGGQIEAMQGQLAKAGAKLTRLRGQACKKFKTLVEGQFRELEMHEATLDVDLRTRAADDPAVDSSGLEEMEFLVRTNPGQDLLPLRKIASGGEISRIMLALKTILADKDQITVLVFDEIDANIGDRLGATIGRKLMALANGAAPRGMAVPAMGTTGVSPVAGRGETPPRRMGKMPMPRMGETPMPQDGARQVICITHLSQIAACADHHLRISKDVVGPDKDRQTVATVGTLEGDRRVRELAEMMAGKTPTAATLAHARELLESARKARAELQRA
jgi:DNA repair protein RecN (Recombination protein N)